MPVLCLGLANCAPAPQTEPAPQPGTPEPSKASQDAAKYYAYIQETLRSRGLMRTDGGEMDVPFTGRDLTENFVQVALYNEFDLSRGRLVAGHSKSPLRRWEDPVRIAVTFGGHVPPDRQVEDLTTVRKLAGQIGRSTRHPVRVTSPESANFHVLVVNEDDRRAIEPTLRALAPDIDPTAIRLIRDLPRRSYCSVIAFSNGDSPVYRKAIAVIRDEHPTLMRRGCFHEELAQGFGLVNDSPRARPSIFNDDQEFLILTRHDELLLRILYDPRLRPGMTEDEARPIITRIVDELMGGSS